jgi:ketosteroid isomerase-like protein
MKRLRYLVLILFFMAICPLLKADDASGTEADHEALRGLKAVFEKAVNENNLELLRPHLHEPFSFVTLTRKEFTEFETFKTQWQSTREKMLDGGTYVIKLDPDRSEIFGDMAITKGRSENVMVTGGGDKYEFTENWTAVCRKINGEWKIVRAHSSIDPFYNPIVLSQFKKMSIQIGLGALAVGLIIGIFVKTMLSRKKKKAITQG